MTKPVDNPADDHEVEAALEATQGLHLACVTRVCAGGIRALVARIRADAARNRALESAADTLLRAIDDMHARGWTFSGRVSISAAELRTALGAAGAGEGQGG